jgi:Zn finger protein HypA/HybF involved in hydrogenase expression
VHELSLVAELVQACEQRAGGARVTLVRVRHAAWMPEPALREAFDALAAGTALAGADLLAEAVERTLRCGCGFSGPLGHDDLAAGLAVCPGCGEVSDAGRTPELELLELRLADPASGDADHDTERAADRSR